MTIDKETANQALATLEREKQEIKERLLRAAQARNTLNSFKLYYNG